MNVLDHEKQIFEYEKTLKQLKEQNKENVIWSDDEIQKLEGKLEDLKKNVYSKLSSWERIQICRHQDRPKSLDFIKNICSSFEEIHGDRLFRDDHAIITGFGVIGDQKYVIVAQEKGNDTESRLYRNFGMPYPEGYRKALRAMKLAEKFHLPVLTIIDTPGAHCGLEAEERGQGWAIANNLFEMASLKTPILALLVGEGCSGGALAIGVADVVVMLEHAYYSVITPEGCASILWKDATAKDKSSEALKLHAEDLMKFSIVDDMIAEPMGGAHHDPSFVYENVKAYLGRKIKELLSHETSRLVEKRHEKYRNLGRYLEEAK